MNRRDLTALITDLRLMSGKLESIVTGIDGAIQHGRRGETELQAAADHIANAEAEIDAATNELEKLLQPIRGGHDKGTDHRP